jgi:hypothetical protein
VTVRHWLLNVRRRSRALLQNTASNPNGWERGVVCCHPRPLDAQYPACRSSVPETLGLSCHYCGTSSRSSFVLAGLRVATLEHAICDCEGSHFVEPKERDCGAGRATGDLVNTLGGRFRYPLQCCDKVNSRALRTVDTCMCSHIPQ